MHRRLIALALVLTASAALAPACGTQASGVETCRAVESARCAQAPNCNVDLTRPVAADSSKGGVDACIRFYDTACLHGLPVNDPGAIATKACIDAINTAGCDTVLHPETNPACAWLNPPSAVDAAIDASIDADAAPDSGSASNPDSSLDAPITADASEGG